MAALRTVMLRLVILIFIIFCKRKASFASANSICYSFRSSNVQGVEEVDVSYIYPSIWQFNHMYGVRLRRKTALQLILLLSGDIEICPGPIQEWSEIPHLTNCRGMKCFHLNTRGLWNNFAFISEILSSNRRIDIFSLSETHITDTACEPEELFNIDGYTFVSKPRSTGQGGGVGIYIADSVNWIRRYDLEKSEIECIWIELSPHKAKSILLCTIYRPPDSSKYLHRNFEYYFSEMLAFANHNSIEIIIMGDINVNYLKANDNVEIKASLSLNGFKQLLKTATRTQGESATLIDIIATTNPSVISDIAVIPCSFSDHDIIGCVRKLNHFKYNSKQINCRDYRNYDATELRNDLLLSDWTDFNNCSDVNIAWMYMRNILLKSFDKFVPKIVKRIRGKPCPWVTTDLKGKMNTRDQLLRKSRKSKLYTDIDAYKSKRNEVNKLVRKAKLNYHKKLLDESSNDPNRFWKAIKKLFPGKSTNPPPPTFKINETDTTDSTLISNGFCSYFTNIISHLKTSAFKLRDCVWIQQKQTTSYTNKTFKFRKVTAIQIDNLLNKLKRKKSTGLDGIPPSLLRDCSSVIAAPLSHIINLSMSTGVYPTDWKRSKIIPVYKSGSNNNIENYRPISVIPAISKIAEKVIHSQLTNYLEENSLINDDQFGFRRLRSTEHAAIQFTDNIKKKVNEGKLVGSVFIDLTKAFDTLSHSKLLLKLSSYGINNNELDWFKDYLFNRSQCVQYNNSLSKEEKVSCGVPQGSIVGPLLFTLFFNDFYTCLKHSRAVKYADDTVIYLAGKDTFIIESRLSADMQAISNWCTDNELILNLKKAKLSSCYLELPNAYQCILIPSTSGISIIQFQSPLAINTLV